MEIGLKEIAIAAFSAAVAAAIFHYDAIGWFLAGCTFCVVILAFKERDRWKP